MGFRSLLAFWMGGASRVRDYFTAPNTAIYIRASAFTVVGGTPAGSGNALYSRFVHGIGIFK